MLAGVTIIEADRQSVCAYRRAVPIMAHKHHRALGALRAGGHHECLHGELEAPSGNSVQGSDLAAPCSVPDGWMLRPRTAAGREQASNE